ncbi:hypothetical protein GeomeDRAFT_0282 [Geobacter metallireducens RCH3]|uniref:Membrane protein, putative n=1 Tax=Geobacter metallireducens (strain ATCC 53774 / DSM 7210 / GS-15) TaxID=269799 RepID=Q39VT6_GEOMG|nr:hypothetical protein [Geobacter metallireducens]ABB31638.1 membrane protein, putative [Geobacter metallireducens GS-15]EHP89484.1 hypothetical protein GeomeDRAFT_0282 [Geobacter metallireducens RCH3]
MNIRKSFQVMLLWMIVLGIFYPAIFAGLNSVDDQKMLYALGELPNRALLDWFRPGQSFYYRPLLSFTFRLDYLLWGQEVSFYHLENILIHGASATLIFFILRQLVSLQIPQQKDTEWPLIGALLFALHPIVTESVNWISGRTDLLGTFFVLSATLVLLQSALRRRLILVIAAAILLFCAIFSKEVMVFSIPAAAFLLWRWSVDAPTSWRIKSLTVLLMPFFFGGSAFIALRWLFYGASADLDRLIFKYYYSAYDTVRVFFKVLGFYGKKIVAPLPLNFAIMQVSDHYVWLGIVIFILAVLLFFLRRSATDLILVGWYLILPGILIALIGLAWTPLAERYVYLPSAFVVMGIALYGSSVPSQRLQKIMLIGLSLFLLPISMATVNRNFIWQDNTKLYADSLSKSPEFAAMSNELGIALIDEGKLAQATQILQKGKQLKTASVLLYINQARIFMAQGDLAGARSEMMKVCFDKNAADTEALKMLATIDEQRLHNGGQSESIMLELLDTYQVLITKTKNPYLEYRVGQIFLSTGKHQDAADYFSRAYVHAPKNAYYREAAGKLVRKLKNSDKEG